MRILVTGGAGFIASHIVDKLVNLGHKVIITDNLITGRESNINQAAKFYKCDITNLQALDIIFSVERPHVVIHHAAQVDVQLSLKDPQLDVGTNLLGSLNILECCKKYDVNKIIYASSSAVYGNPEYIPVDEGCSPAPISFYGISKYVPEIYMKLYYDFYGIKYTILRYSNVYGIRQSAENGGAVSKFMDSFTKSLPCIIYGDGEQLRDFVYIKDVVNANILSINKGDNDAFNICTGKACSINELYLIISRHFPKGNVIYAKARSGDIQKSCLKNDKAVRVLGWQPEYNLSMGIEEMANYCGGNYGG